MIRQQLDVDEDTVIYLHSGKLTKEKKTAELVDAFVEAKCDNAVLVILGVMDDDTKAIVKPKLDGVTDGSIRFLGWKNSEELNQYLCAADVYAQPGNPSATFQNAMCCSCAVISYPHEEYVGAFVDKNGLLAKDKDEIKNAIKQIASDHNLLSEMKKESYRIADSILDYVKQGRRIIDDCFPKDI